MMGLATTFALSLLSGFAAVACAYKLLLNALVVAAGESLESSSEDGERGNLGIWPRDKAKIIARMLALLLLVVVFMTLSYVLARRAFAHP